MICTESNAFQKEVKKEDKKEDKKEEKKEEKKDAAKEDKAAKASNRLSLRLGSFFKGGSSEETKEEKVRPCLDVVSGCEAY